MRRKMSVFQLFVLSILMIISACGDSDRLDVIHLSGQDCIISSDTKWTNGNIYVVHDSMIIENVTLTIEAGTIVKIARNQDGNVIAQPFIIRGNTGMIKAIGTEKNHIVFTCFTDDSIAGDTNGDSSLTLPARGEWGHIFINASSDSAVSEFAYCDFCYGGDSNYETGAMLDVQFAIAEVDHCTFAHSEHAGLDIMDAEKATTVTNNVFYDKGISIN